MLKNLRYEERVGSFHPEEEKASGESYYNLPVGNWWLRGQQLSLQKESHREDKEQWVQALPGDVLS